MARNRRAWVWCAMFALGSPLMGAGEAAAYEVRRVPGLVIDGSVVIDPPNERISARPGSTVRRQIRVTNRSDERRIVTMTRASGVAEPPGSRQVEIKFDEVRGAARWTSLERPQLDLPPQTRGTLSMQVEIPCTVRTSRWTEFVAISATATGAARAGDGVLVNLRVSTIFGFDVTGSPTAACAPAREKRNGHVGRLLAAFGVLGAFGAAVAGWWLIRRRDDQS